MSDRPKPGTKPARQHVCGCISQNRGTFTAWIPCHTAQCVTASKRPKGMD